MTREEAIDILKNDIEICTPNQEEAVDIAIRALEKDIPKKPISKPDGFGLKIKVCPNCGKQADITDKFCSGCGYKL